MTTIRVPAERMFQEHWSSPIIVLTCGLRRQLDLLATEAILADEERRHGGQPPRIAALLGHPDASS